jgi:hypothetical protein
MGETEAKKAEKEAAIEKLSTQIDSMNARSGRLRPGQKSSVWLWIPNLGFGGANPGFGSPNQGCTSKSSI